jgi:uncharacterized surface protein with fasciclin (FAS1) repeats
MMIRKAFLALVVLIASVSIVSAQSETARLRVIQLSYTDTHWTIDVLLDGEVVFEGIAWPFATDYVELAPGEHTLTTIMADAPEVSASVTVVVEAAHRYSVVVHGHYREGVTFTMIDENTLPLEETGSAGVIINMTGAPISKLTVNDVPIIASIPAGSQAALSLPVTPFTISGKLGEEDYSEEFVPLSNAILLAVVRQNPDGAIQILYQRSSPLTVAEYLQAVQPETQFARAAEAITASGLLDALPADGELTLFLPTNAAFDRAAEGGLPEPDRLSDLLEGHIVAQSLPPTVLPDHTVLTMLNSGSAQIDFGQTTSGFWEIEGAAIRWDVRLADGVIYAIDGVITTR